MGPVKQVAQRVLRALKVLIGVDVRRRDGEMQAQQQRQRQNQTVVPDHGTSAGEGQCLVD